MKKVFTIILTLCLLLCTVSCSVSDDMASGYQETDTNNTVPQINDEPVKEPSYTDEYDQIFRKIYPKISELDLNEKTATETIYTLNKGRIVYTVNETSVVFTNLDDNGFKIGVFWGADPALKSQEKRILVRSGYFSVASMSLEEQYNSILALLTDEEKAIAPSYDEFNNNKVLVNKSSSGGENYEYTNQNMTIKIEISGSYGKQTSRTLVYDIY